MRAARATAQNHIPIAREIMKTSLTTLTPDMPIIEAVKALLKNRISGAPVLDADGKLVGICSELDCLRVLAAGEFYRDDHHEDGRVGDSMSTELITVGPDEDIYRLAQFFLTHSIRRLPVVESGELLGQISRRDVLAGMEKMGEHTVVRRRYPDYLEPAGDVGARRVE